jgi:hypothetical protein
MSEALQKQLAEAKENYRVVIQRGSTSRVPLSEYLSAGEKVLEAERALAAATGDQYAVPMELGYAPEAAVSAPMLLQTDSSTFLTFRAVTIKPDGCRAEAGTAVIEFDLCFWTSFGYPNDEALSGHPLYGRGLSAYEIFEVRNSHWVHRMNQQNRIPFPNTKGDFDSRHFIFSFHDSTFECLCQGIKSSTLSAIEYPQILSGLSQKILDRKNLS